MNTLLYFIVFTVVFYYLSKFIMRWVMPFALRKLTERIMKKAQQQGSYTYGQPFGQSNPFGDQYQDNSGKRDSRVKVDYVPQQEEKRKGTATAGEFIDFEEIK